MSMKETVSEVVDALGGNGAVAEMMLVRPSAVSNWRRIDRFPPRLSLRLIKLARERGVLIPQHLFEEVDNKTRAERAN